MVDSTNFGLLKSPLLFCHCFHISVKPSCLVNVSMILLATRLNELKTFHANPPKQARSKAKITRGPSKMVKQNYSPPPPPPPGPSPRQIRELRCNENTFWYISLPFSFYVDYHVKFPNFTFEGGRKQTRTIFFPFLNLESGSAARFLENPTAGKFCS